MTPLTVRTGSTAFTPTIGISTAVRMTLVPNPPRPPMTAAAKATTPTQASVAGSISKRRSARAACASHRALAYVSFRDAGLRLGRGRGMAVEIDRDLVRGAELRIGAALLVDQAEDVPFVVRAAADRGRRAEPVVLAEGRFRQAAALDCLGE